jgi:hypothetical protein
MEPGEWELELGNDAVRSPEGGWSYGQVAEIEHGFDEHFAASAYLLGTWKPGGSWRVDGYKLQGRFRPWLSNRFYLPAFYLEYEQFHHPETYREAVVGQVAEEAEAAFSTEHEGELRLLFSQTFDWGGVALNLVGERSLDGGSTAYGYTGGLYLTGARRMIPGAPAFDPDGDGDAHLLYGLELFGGLGEGRGLRVSRGGREHYLQPFVSLPLTPRLSLKGATALGLTASSSDLIRVLLVVRLAGS